MTYETQELGDQVLLHTPSSVQYIMQGQFQERDGYQKVVHATWIENYIRELKQWDEAPISPTVPDDHDFPFASMELKPEKEKDYVAYREESFLQLRGLFPSNESLGAYLQQLDAMKFSVAYREKAGIVQLLSRHNSHLFATIAFRDRIRDSAVLGGCSHLMHRLNRSIFGSSRRDERECLTGYAVLEPHTKRRQHEGYLHAHFVFDANARVTPDILEYALLEEVVGVRSLVKTKREPLGRRLIEDGSIDVRPVTGRRGLAVYLTKCIGSRQWAGSANVMLIGKEGLARAFSRGYRFGK